MDACVEGIHGPELDPVALRVQTCAQSDAGDLLWADGLIIATPENFGYMSGAMKDFFDRTFYEVEGKLRPLPYLIIVSAGNDGSGAVRAIERIANGYPLQSIAPATVITGQPDAPAFALCRERAMTLAAGLALGMY